MNARLIIIFLSCLLLWLSGCGTGFQGGGRKTFHSTFTPGHEALIKNEKEKSGYGLYSYVLFPLAPNDDTKSLYLQTIKACLKTKSVDTLEGTGLSPHQLNVVYLPVLKDPRRLPQSTMEQMDLQQWSEWILEQYDFDRAKDILKQIPEGQGRGPFILSTTYPTSIPQWHARAHLLQNLSSIPTSNPNLAYFWVKDFIGLASDPQDWNRNLLHFTRNVQGQISSTIQKRNFQTQVPITQLIMISEPQL